TAQQIKLRAHQHRARERRPKGSGPGLDDEGKGVPRVVRTVGDSDGRSGFEEGAEIESELLGLAGDYAGLERQSQYVEWDLGSEEWPLIVAELDRSFHCYLSLSCRKTLNSNLGISFSLGKKKTTWVESFFVFCFLFLKQHLKES
ncbi:hypothetical protein PanWU01x14_210550, partial [Parasponia andersonii]